MPRRSSGRHGPTYHTWRAMLRRCEHAKDVGYTNYGGRGITVCERWKSFDNFIADMGPRPDGLSIDRINNDGNYEPGNCRWATQKEQMRNTRGNVLYEWEGEVLCLAEIAERFAVEPRLLRTRLVAGWSLKRAIETPASAYHGAPPVPRPYSPVQVCMAAFRERRRELEASGLTADQIANRAARPDDVLDSEQGAA